MLLSNPVFMTNNFMFKKSVELYSLATPLLAPMIEEGFVNNAISRSVLETYLSDPQLKILMPYCLHVPIIRLLNRK